jgi:ABC-2 type transport system ATP-binding protein
MEGVTNLEKRNNTVSLFYKGDINVITKMISAQTVSDVSIEEPTLEEIFMHYYE